MKKIFFIALLSLALLSQLGLNAQSLSPSVYPATGASGTISGNTWSYTIGEMSYTTVTNGIRTLSQGFEQPEIQINTGTITGPLCAGQAIVVSYIAYGFIDLAGTNVFTAQLSNSSGSFASPVSIGTVVSNTTGTINAVIPLATAAGLNYRIRVVSSLPVFNGRNNGADIVINANCPNTWLGGSTQWSQPTNWSLGVVPNTCADNVLIPTSPANGANFPLIGLSSFTVGDLTVQSGASITINNTRTLSICGNLNGGATTAGTVGGTSTNGLVLIGSGAQTITGTLNVNLLKINNTSTGVTNNGDIEVNTALVMQDGDFTNSGSVTLKSNASTTAYLDNFTNGTAGTYSGSITAERHVSSTANGYRDISSPVSTTVAGLSDDISIFGQNGVNCWYSYNPYPNVQVYDEALSIVNGNYYEGWKSYTGLSNPLSAMKGVAIRTYAGAPYTIDLTGTPYNGPQSIGITHTSTGTANADGWNFVGNPYPSPIDWNDVFAANSGIGASYYAFNTTGEYTGNYSSWNGGSGVNGGTRNIAVGQGFFVFKTAPGTQSLSMTNTVREAEASTVFHKSNPVMPDEVRLQLTGSGNSDEIVAYTDGSATWGFDVNYDAQKIAAGSTVYMSYKHLDTEYAIDVIDEVNINTELPLIVWAQDTGIYTLEATELNLTGLVAYLKDSEANTFTDLTTIIPSLQLNGGQTYANYSIVFKEEEQPSAINNTEFGKGINIYSFNNKAIVERPTDSKATITITNLLGQTIKEVTTDNKRMEIQLDNVNPWYAIVKVKEANATKTGKVLIK